MPHPSHAGALRAFISTTLLCGMTMAGEAPIEGSVQFFDTYCGECHYEDASGGLDLGVLAFDPQNKDNLATWVRIFDRVSTGEMPPKKRDKKRPTPADLAIAIVGYQYGWRYDYPDPTRGAAVRCRADALVLPQGRVVELTLTADDVIHEWRVPALGLQSDAIPGLLNIVRVETGKAGAFEGGATSLSGDGYRQMAFELRILAPEAYEAWRQTALTPCRTP